MQATATKTDARIHKDVLQELKWDPRVDETEVGVQVKNGLVSLTGNVSDYAKKFAAEEAAHRVTGVLDVVNDLIVRIPGVGQKTDEEIARAVRSALEWDVLVPDQSIRTTVSRGWVTLEGEVNRLTQKEDAEYCVRRLAGLTGVTNSIRVKVPAVDAGKVRTQIEQALERQAEREARRINVAVADGTVRLSGTVRSWAERRAVERAAEFAPGVKRVEGSLVVDPYQ